MDTLIVARFAAPTSAGILFTMLAAAGLAGSWVFRKVRILAIFDDLDTILFLIPIQVLMIGFALPLAVNLFVTVGVLFLAYRYMHQFPLSTSEWAILLYSAMLCIIYPFEILLPAFCLGAMIRVKGHEQEVLDPWIKAAFMFFVGFSMTQITWDFSLITPVIIITILSNLGKCFPLFCYRDRPLRERLAVSIAIFPRGEVGGGVLALSLSYHLESHAITIAALSLALNLLMTPLFIWAVQWCIKEKPAT